VLVVLCGFATSLAQRKSGGAADSIAFPILCMQLLVLSTALVIIP
jgi:hypothetical protein